MSAPYPLHPRSAQFSNWAPAPCLHIPQCWYGHPAFDTAGKEPKTNQAALMVLADLMTDDPADPPAYSYKARAQVFGHTVGQMKAAVDFLVDRELVTKELREVEGTAGLATYLRPNIEKIPAQFSKNRGKPRTPKRPHAHKGEK